MKKLIKADLSKIIELSAEYQPTDRNILTAELEMVAQNKDNDYLLLAQNGSFRVMALSEVYTCGSSSNAFLHSLEAQICRPILAMLLHVEYVENGIHGGSVILADYSEFVRDVELLDRLPNAQRERHIKQMISRCLRYAPQCTMMELIEYLKTGRCD